MNGIIFLVETASSVPLLMRHFYIRTDTKTRPAQRRGPSENLGGLRHEPTGAATLAVSRDGGREGGRERGRSMEWMGKLFRGKWPRTARAELKS